jgi:hypothetical protein
MNDYIAKPVQLNRLSEALGRWLGPAVQSETAPIEGAVALNRDSSVFDEGALLTRLLDDRALAGEIIRGFLADCPIQLTILCERIEEGDNEGVRRQAHKVKGPPVRSRRRTCALSPK